MPGAHFEVKFGVTGMDLGTSLLTKAWEQAEACNPWPDRRVPVVLWKPMRKCWRLTYMRDQRLVTVAGDDDIRGTLLALNGGGE